jgi:hypothetical protein
MFFLKNNLKSKTPFKFEFYGKITLLILILHQTFSFFFPKATREKGLQGNQTSFSNQKKKKNNSKPVPKTFYQKEKVDAKKGSYS